jgi:hypothetical protein
MFASCEFTKVPCGFGDHIIEKLEDDMQMIGVFPDFDIELEESWDRWNI